MENFKYSTQTINKKDIVNVSKVLKSEFLTQGPKTIEFENKIKLLVKSKYALVVNSGSSALLLACKALSLKSGDLFWTTPNSFVATANCGVLCGLKIDFIDIDPEIALRRGLARNSGEDRFEEFGLEFQQALRRGFLNLAKKYLKISVTIFL